MNSTEAAASGGSDAAQLRPPTAPLPEEPGARSPWRWVLASLVLLALVGLSVIVYLPGWVAEQSQQNTKSTPSLEPVPLAATAVQRQQAEQSLQRFLRLQAELQHINAPVWAADEWQAAEARVAGGDRLFGERRFADADRAYRTAIADLESLRDSRASRLNSTLQAGDAALADNHVAAAVAQYETALLIEADHPGALRGLQRAQVREALLQAMQVAADAQQQGETDAALAQLQRAVELDADYQPARLALADLQTRLLERDFQAAMNAALAALEQGRYVDARRALDRAAGLQPGHAAVTDARERLQRMERQTTMNRLRNQAEAAVRAEQWDIAVSRYQQALKINGDAAFAQAGLVGAKQKAALHDRFDEFLEAPQRLYSDAPLRSAEQLLASTGSVSGHEPRLAEKVRALQEQVDVAKQPLQLQLRSDGETEVTVFHVGRLGRFLLHQLDLRPGRYTVTGVRKGYRDVRRIVELQPGTAPATLTIQCEEPL